MKGTEEEVEILKQYYPSYGVNKCFELLENRTKRQIKDKARKSGISSNNYQKWTCEEEKMLEEAGKNFTMQELLNAYPNRTYQEIELHAHYLGYHTPNNRGKKTDLSFLELDTLNAKSAYGWGFIMADGHLSKTNSLIISLKNTDIEHLKKLGDLTKVNIKERNGFCYYTAGDSKLITKWKNTLCITQTAKTFFPPNLSVFKDFFIYFLIGFIDGDGCIGFNKSYPQIKIELHESGKANLDWFAEILRSEYGLTSVSTKISVKGTAVLTIGNRKDIVKISEYCKDVDFLERKGIPVLMYNPKCVRRRTKTYSEYISELQRLEVFNVKEAYRRNMHPDRGAKRFSVTLEQINTDLQNKT